MKKKGSSEQLIIYTFYIAIGLVLMPWIIYGTKSASENTYLKISHQSKDIGLLIDTLYFSPQMATVKYPATEGFSYTIAKGKVIVKEKVSNAFEFAEDNNKELEISEKDKRIIITKK